MRKRKRSPRPIQGHQVRRGTYWGDALRLRARSGTGYQSDRDESSHLLSPLMWRG